MKFSNPRTSNIIIFDETNASLLQSVIPKKLTVSIFKMRPVEFHLTPIIVMKFLMNLRYVKLRGGGFSNRGIFYRIFFQLLCVYIKTDLSCRKPKAIITSIDNCSKFAWLSENFQHAPCIAIQNGFRLSYDANPMNKYYCQNLFCFGDREIADFKEMGYRVDKFYPVGSLSLSLHFNEYLAGTKPKHDLLIVSCWRGNISYAQDVEDSMTAMRKMDERLSTYLRSRNLNAAVILRSERDSEHWFMPEVGLTEEEYYKSIYDDLIEIIDVNFVERNVYPVMQSAEVIIAGFSTTCLIEAYAMRKKVLYMNFCGHDKYHRDFKPEIVFEAHDDKSLSFESRLDALLEISIKQYVSMHEEMMEFYMRDPRSSPLDQIRRGISDIIARKPDHMRTMK